MVELSHSWIRDNKVFVNNIEQHRVTKNSKMY